MIPLINQLTGGTMWVHESRLEEYLAAGHKLAASPKLTGAPKAKPEAPAAKKPAAKKKPKK